MIANIMFFVSGIFGGVVLLEVAYRIRIGILKKKELLRQEFSYLDERIRDSNNQWVASLQLLTKRVEALEKQAEEMAGVYKE